MKYRFDLSISCAWKPFIDKHTIALELVAHVTSSGCRLPDPVSVIIFCVNMQTTDSRHYLTCNYKVMTGRADQPDADQ